MTMQQSINWHAGWTLTSIAGFSGVFARALDRSIAIRFASGTITTNQPLSTTRDVGAPRGPMNGLHGTIGSGIYHEGYFVTILAL